MTIPSKEAVAYGRAAVLREVERLDKGADEFRTKGNELAAVKWRFAAFWMRRMLGHGCVIGPFDERWLDDEFRAEARLAREEGAPI